MKTSPTVKSSLLRALLCVVMALAAGPAMTQSVTTGTSSTTVNTGSGTTVSATTTGTNVTAVTTTGSQVVQNFNISLKAFVQTPSSSGGTQIKTQTINNKTVVQELSALTGVDLSGGTLVVISPLGTTDIVTELETPPTFEVRSKTQILADVTSFFTVNVLGTPVVGTKANGTGTTVNSIKQYVFNGTNITFDVQGFSTGTFKATNQGGGVVSTARQDRTTVAGNGTIAGEPAVIQGTISTSGNRVETIP